MSRLYMLIKTSTALLLLLVGSVSSVQGADDTNVWLASERGKVDLSGFSQANLAIGIPEDIARTQIARILTLETAKLGVSTKPINVTLERQTVSAISDFYIWIPRLNQRFNGQVTFSIALNFSGKEIAFLPHVESVLLRDSSSGTGSKKVTPNSQDLVVDELQRAIVKYLSDRGFLQMPTALATDFDLSAKALYEGGKVSPVTLSQSDITGELWISSSAILIDRSGIMAIAEAKYDLTLPQCPYGDPTVVVTGGFTDFNSSKTITVIGANESAVMFRGNTNVAQLKYRAYWRIGNSTIASHNVQVQVQGPNRGDMEVAITSLPDLSGLYSLMIVADIPLPGSETEVITCQVSSFRIIKQKKLLSDPPKPMTPEIANAAFDMYSQQFNKILRQGGFSRYSNLFAGLSKPLIAQVLNRTMNGIGLKATLDAKKLPRVGPFTANIKVPDPAKVIACTPTRNCTPSRVCILGDCPYTHDRRNCRRKIPLDGSFNEPFCEAAKAIENARRAAEHGFCKARAAAAKFDCERLKSQEKLQCEIEKASEKALCETLKGTLELITEIAVPNDRIASVKGDFSFSGSSHMALNNIHLDDRLRDLALQLTLDANLTINAGIEFIPIDIGGHIIGCLSKWKETTELHTRIPARIEILRGTIQIDNANKKVVLNSKIKARQIRTTPPFIALFSQHPYLVPLCPVLFTAGVGEGIYSLLSDEYKSTIWTGDFQIEAIDLNYAVELPGLVIPPQYGLPQPQLQMNEFGSTIVWR